MSAAWNVLLAVAALGWTQNAAVYMSQRRIGQWAANSTLSVLAVTWLVLRLS